MAVAGPTKDHDEIQSWAILNGAVPAERLPHVLDHIPTVIRLMLAAQVQGHPDLRIITWDEFFLKFDALGLSFVYDTDPTGYNEILQSETSPKTGPKHVAAGFYH